MGLVLVLLKSSPKVSIVEAEEVSMDECFDKGVFSKSPGVCQLLL